MSKKRADWSAILLQEAPQGVVCIRKPLDDKARKGVVRYWQFPGGKKNPGENPEQTAVRENFEETGILLALSQVHLVNSEIQYNHHTHNPFRLYFFRATISRTQTGRRIEIGDEGERIRIFTWTELNARNDFSPFHYALALKYRVWRK